MIAGALIGGAAMGYSVWESLGVAFLAVVFSQMLVLGFIVTSAIRATSRLGAKRPDESLGPCGKLYVLPK
ncbi:hypothetical protein [Paracoccus sp. Ld10]|uniref:hypothetical protein n=1 Tax=Paracoccus sp. Ld10 TaxID=649158 RepID=UPI00386D1A88